MSLSVKERRRVIQALADPSAAKELCDAYDAAAGNSLDQFLFVPLGDFDAGDSFTEIPVATFEEAVTIKNIRLIAQGAFVGVDNSNPIVIAAYDSLQNLLVSKTYNAGTPPTDNDANDLGTITAAYASLAANASLNLAINCGATANMPAFAVLVRYQAR